MISTYQVGKLYNPAQTRWEELPEYNFRKGQHELLLFFRSPSKAEIESVKTGQARFAFAIERGVIFFLYEFATGVPWEDAAFQFHLVPKPEQIIPEPLPTPDTRAILSVLLIDAATGIIKAMRLVTFTPEFTEALHAAIQAQAESPFDPAAHRANVQQVYVQNSTQDLRQKAIAKCKGGT